MPTPTTSTPPRFALDHLVLAAANLDTGARLVEQAIGLAPVAGGRHLTMGTHNRVLNLDDARAAGTYLEVIAIDPEQAAPAQPRWFGLDVPEVLGACVRRPALIAWVVRVEGAADAIDELHAAFPQWIGAPQPFERSDYRWRMAIPAPLDGCDTRRFDGLFPVFIQWDVAHHPAMRLPATDARLARLDAEHPQARELRSALAAVGVDALIHVNQGPASRLRARVFCGNAMKELE